MSRAAFHPCVEAWFRAHIGNPTSAQMDGWRAIQDGKHTLIAAPTGSGKTLAAFLSALNDLFCEALSGGLPDETRVLYISPLKALSNDIHKNLEAPLAGIRQALQDASLGDVLVTQAVRTGDTPPSQRQRMLRRPPHILVTTPESFYLLITSQLGRRCLSTVRTVIVDEIHALAGNRRGAHLALSLERLQAITAQPPQRIGLSATQKPISEIAHYLIGVRPEQPPCAVIDTGHTRPIDLRIELPESPMEAVMANEVWEEIYNRLAMLIAEHRTTLIFVNTRRLAERITHNLNERVGAENITSHHGSLSTKIRHAAETRLKQGQLKALVATASLEMGIDIGEVDLVCQIGSTHAIASLLQRVGRSGHWHGGLSKGRLFPLSRDDLIECAALCRAVHAGDLDRLQVPEHPLDILAQQIVAASACDDWQAEDLFKLCTRASPYAHLSRRDFDNVVHMLADGFTTRRGRRGAHIHYDGVNDRIRGRRGARLAALISGGAIPENADYRVEVDPESTFVGTINEDFAIESMPGDIFQLGNNAWQILKVQNGVVRVRDAQGQPPTIPFWLGEAPARTDELSRAVSQLRSDVEDALGDQRRIDRAAAMLAQDVSVSPEIATQIVDYLAATRDVLGVIPSQKNIVIERFFDEAGGMQMVIHSPFGGRINRGWGLALRKRFCRSFNFELQAAANEDAIVLSLGETHSFPLDDVFAFLDTKTVRDVLVQALLDAPMFQTRWRWNTNRALAVLRRRQGKKVPANIQRMEAEDLISVVFPDSLACLENIAGERQIPEHPLVQQTIKDCLIEAMDIDGLVALLGKIDRREIQCTAKDVPEPSPAAHEIINVRPYAFLDDAPLEERRTRAVILRRGLDTAKELDLGTDAEAIVSRRTPGLATGAQCRRSARCLADGGSLDRRGSRQPPTRWLVV
ncbi:MAG: DEAD/DEAH box helicase [Myxococcota bacterium]